MKKKVIIIVIILLTAIVLAYSCTHYDHSKANIFEIPQTSTIWNSGDTIRYDKYYFIQNPPKKKENLEEMIWEFIEDNNILNDVAKSGASYAAINFMVASFSLPIWFEENKSYFAMDDYIANYISSNRIALVTFDLDKQTSELIISSPSTTPKYSESTVETVQKPV